MRHKVTRELSAQHAEAMSTVRREAAAAAVSQAAAATAREAAAMDIARVSAAAWEVAVAREAVVAREAATAREAVQATATAARAWAEVETFDVQACNLRFMALRQFIELARRGAGKPKPWRLTLRRASLVNDPIPLPLPLPLPLYPYPYRFITLYHPDAYPHPYPYTLTLTLTLGERPARRVWQEEGRCRGAHAHARQLRRPLRRD